MDEFVKLDATAQAELVASKQVSPLELVDAAIVRIEKLNPQLNAVTNFLFEDARRTAKESVSTGPFAGVPFLLTDLMAGMAGVRLSGGSKLQQGYVPDHDSELVRRYRQAGLIFLGQTNTSEFGFQATTENQLFGTTCNPWNLTRTSGGSSGGATVAVASGMVPMAHGNDVAGSLRIPASCCGVFGLKPSRGRISLGPDYGDIMGGMWVEHALTRSVRDSARLLEAVHGSLPGDPYRVSPPARPYSQLIKGPFPRMRIAFNTKSPVGTPVHPDCISAVVDTVHLLEQLGHQVEPEIFRVDPAQLAKAFLHVWSAGCAEAVTVASKLVEKEPKEGDLEPMTQGLREMGMHRTAVDYLEAVRQFQIAGRIISQQMEDYDLWLTPTLAQPPLPLGELTSTPNEPLRGFLRSPEFTPFTPLANITGQPAMTVPLYWNDDGLPIGSQFMGKYGEEGVLFQLAAQLEEAQPWAWRKPPVSAF